VFSFLKTFEILGGLNAKNLLRFVLKKKVEEDLKKCGGGFEKKMRRRI